MTHPAPQFPQPTPMAIGLGEATFGDRKFIMLRFEGPNGVWVCFLENEQVQQLAHQMLEVTTGIVVAPAGLQGLQLPPTGV